MVPLHRPGFLPRSQENYLKLLDWPTPQIAPGKRGTTPPSTPPLPQQLIGQLPKTGTGTEYGAGPRFRVIPRRSVRHAVEFPAFLTAGIPESPNYCHLLSSKNSRKSDGGNLTIPSLVKPERKLGFQHSSAGESAVQRKGLGGVAPPNLQSDFSILAIRLWQASNFGDT